MRLAGAERGVAPPPLVLWGLGLLLAGGLVGLWPSVDLAVSLQKLGVLALAAAMVVALGRLTHAGREAIGWLLLGAGLCASFAGNVLVDRDSWKLDAFNRVVYGWFGHVPRFSELAFSQNGLAAALILVLPFGLSFTLYGRRRALAGTVTALLLAELLITECRSAVVSLSLACLLFLGLSRSRWRWLGVLGPAAAAGLLASGAVAPPVTLSWLPTGGSSLERLAIWQSALLMIADTPLTGIGLGMFQRVYPLYRLPAYHNTQPHAHNLFLQTYLDAGPLGCAGMALLVAATIAATLRLRRGLPPEQRAVAFGAALANAAVLLQAQVDSYFAGDPRTYPLMLLPLALLARFAPSFRLARGSLPSFRRWAASGTLAVAVALPTSSGWWSHAVWTTSGSIARLKSELEPESQSRQRATARASFDRVHHKGWVAERGLGLLDLDSGRLQEGVAHLRRALDEGAPGQRLQFELGLALLALGRTDEALPHLRAAGAAPYFARQAGSPAALRLALDIDPAAREARLDLARWKLAHGQTAGAKALLAGASDGQSLLLAGLIDYWLEGDSNGGQFELARAVETSPDDESPYRALADVLASEGSTLEADRWRREGDAVNARTHAWSDHLGRDYQAMGLLDRAAGEYRRVARGDPIGSYDLGLLLLSQGSVKEGLAELGQAVQAIPNQREFRLALARAYARAGMPAESRRQYRALLDLDPGSLEARRALASGRVTCPAGCPA